MTTFIGYLRRKYDYFFKKIMIYFKDLITVQNLMLELETSRRAGSGSDKTNKDHKYTLDEALQVMLGFVDESNNCYLSD